MGIALPLELRGPANHCVADSHAIPAKYSPNLKIMDNIFLVHTNTVSKCISIKKNIARHKTSLGAAENIKIETVLDIKKTPSVRSVIIDCPVLIAFAVKCRQSQYERCRCPRSRKWQPGQPKSN